MDEYHPISSKDQSRGHQFGKKVVRGRFLGIEELEILDTSEVHAWELNADQSVTPKSGEQCKFPIPDGTVELSGRDQGFRKSTSRRDQHVRSEELSGDLQGSSESTNRRNNG